MADAEATGRPDAETAWHTDHPTDVVLTLSRLQRSGPDPTHRVADARTLWRTLEEAAGMSPAAAAARLTAVPGVGGWTAAEVAQRALGDADALSLGDHHLAGVVGQVLFGRPFDDEAALVAALAPWRPHRYRVVRLLQAAGHETVPRRGPRARPVDHRGR